MDDRSRQHIVEYDYRQHKGFEFKGGETKAIQLKTGDSVTVTDIEGDQPCQLLAFNTAGELDFNLLESDISVPPTPLKSGDSVSLLAVLQAQGLPNDRLSALNLFAEKSAPKSRSSVRIKADATCVFSAGGGKMSPHDQNPPTKLEVSIETSADASDTTEVDLPKPLATPVQEVHVDAASAVAYRVKAGEYIQIIDVEGHQCSDFQAFAQSDLEAGQSLGIDPTVTRSFNGTSYPSPGILNKFYNQNSTPLVEVVRDLCAQHDTFGTACNAKYYEDRGYIGHRNCTENFNNALADYQVPSRPNWVAVNFFFNTNIEECETISSDVSWSRPGDYVLLRAETDLVCVSSACPDDTTPVNNWNLTSIHVRVYGSDNSFSRALAYRPTAEAKSMTTKETGFHTATSQLTRNFIEYNGYWLPEHFNNYGAIDEYWACRERVVMTDLSPLRKYEITGPDAEALMQYALPRNVRKLAVGQVVYSAICYENGGMIDDGTLYRLCENNFRWIGGSDASGLWLKELAEKKNMQAWVKTSSDELHNVAVQGPRSRDLLSKVIWTKPDQPTIQELGWFRFSIARLGGEKGIPLVVSRTGYTGELGYEVFCHPTDAPEVWKTLWEAGEEYGVAPLGLDALDIVRIEAGLIFAGYEFSDQTDPFEAGIGFSVPLKTKEDDFVGKEAIIRRKANPKEVLVGLEVEGNEVAGHGDGVYVGRQQVGIITSGVRSPILKKNIALCRISVDHAAAGTEVELGKLDGHQKRIPAEVVTFPFYDPEKLRVRS